MSNQDVIKSSISQSIKFLIIPTLIYSILSDNIGIFPLGLNGIVVKSSIEPLMILLLGIPVLISHIAFSSFDRNKSKLIAAFVESAFLILYFFYFIQQGSISISSNNFSLSIYYGEIFMLIMALSIVSLFSKIDF